MDKIFEKWLWLFIPFYIMRYQKQFDDMEADKSKRQSMLSELDEINAMFDREENDPTAFQIFFKNADVNLEQIITDTMTKFSQEFLGGENA